MSALGQKQTYAVLNAMSALPPKADMCSATRDVRFGPKADSCIAAKQSLFDHLVGAAEQAQRERNTQRLRSLEIDDQLDFCDLLHRQVGRPFALENPAGIDTGLPPSIKIVRSVAHKPASRDVFAH